LWNTFHAQKDIRSALEKTLKLLKIEYLDLYLIHWPMGYKESGDNLFPKNEKDEVLFSDVDFVETWKGLEDLVDAGLVKSIGVSNFNSK
jgi:aldehyde reductase